jgi:hypothetical protein
MTPKEKAIELVSTFKPYADYTECDIFNQVERMHINAKIIALIAVEEILKCNLETSVSSNPHIEFNSKLLNQYQWWKEVKQEIEKL